MCEVLLWDHDGILVDTERWYFEATRTVLADIAVDLTHERYLDFMACGRSCWDLARTAGVAEEIVAGLRQRRDELYQRFLQTQDIEIPGVAEVLEELGSEYRMAIVTTARRVDFDLIHRQRTLLRHFELALTFEDYERAKPAPDPYLTAIARLNAKPGRAVVVEDSARGLKAALAAGIRCLIVRSAFTMAQDFSGAWRIVDSIREVPGMLGVDGADGSSRGR
jgi:HAD superfamily hydrolase (TIGR01509 family)